MAEGDVISGTAAILEQLRVANAQPVGAQEMSDMAPGKIKMYAVSFGTGRDRIYFLQRRIETIIGSGKLLTRFFGDQMHLVEEPSLVLPNSFEAILHPLGVDVLRGDLFDRLLRDGANTAREVNEYITAFEARVPLNEASRGALSDQAQKYRFIRRRFRTVIDHGRFQNLTLELIRDSCDRTGIDNAVFFDEDELKIDKSNADRFLRFLNDEVYRGVFSNELLAADGTAPFQ